MVCKELSYDVYSVLYKSAEAIHSVGFPLTFVDSTIVPVVLTQALSFVVGKLPFVPVSVLPCVNSLAILLPLNELSLVFLAVLQIKLSESIFDVVLPSPFIDITIPVSINTLISLVLIETAIKNITIKKSQFSLYLGIFFPQTTKNSSLTKKVVALPMFFTLNELSYVFIFIRILEIPDSMRQLISKLSCIDASIRIYHASFSLYDSLYVLSNVNNFVYFVLEVSVTVFHTVFPLPFVVLLRRVQDSAFVFQIIQPRSCIKTCDIFVVVRPSSVFKRALQKSIIDLSG